AYKVTLACLETRDTMPASAEEIARAEEEGIEIIPGWGLSKVVEENGKVKGMQIKRCVSVIDEKGAFNPQYDECEIQIIKAENIMLATGQRVDLSYFGEKYEIQLTRRGLLDVDEDTAMTSRKGVFGAGDAVKPGLAIAAIATGRKAAIGINTYLGVPNDVVIAEKDPLSFDNEGVKVTEPLVLRELSVEKRRIDAEDSESHTIEEAARETLRCMNCGCHAVHPSDVAPALIALDARIVTNCRTIHAEDFFAVRISCNTILDKDEIITEIQIPAPPAGAKSVFMKFAFRKSIDFPVVNVAAMTGSKPRICLNAVAPTPIRAVKAEAVIAGKKLDENLAAAAGEAAVQDAIPLEAAKYKVQIAKTIVKRALLSTIE
ncbi:MAG: FAD-dependent oxidoreductase, partial [Clostridiales bacterium]|nr:FAD-dependent oxidoreductase [Clostridiales bacterium]